MASLLPFPWQDEEPSRGDLIDPTPAQFYTSRASGISRTSSDTNNNWRRTMSVRRITPMLVGAVLALSTMTASFETVTAQSNQNRPRIKMLTPKARDVFRPGDHVLITWEYIYPEGA